MIPGVEFDYTTGGSFYKNHEDRKHAVSGQTLLLGAGKWNIRVHYFLKDFQIEINNNKDKNERIQIPSLGGIEINKLPDDIKSEQVSINELPWDGKTIRIPSGKATIHIDSPYYRNTYEVMVSSEAVSEFVFPMKQYGALLIELDGGVYVNTVQPKLDDWKKSFPQEVSKLYERALRRDREDRENEEEEKRRMRSHEANDDRKDSDRHCENSYDMRYRGTPGSYTVHTSQGDKYISIRLGQVETIALDSKTDEELARLSDCPPRPPREIKTSCRR